MKLGLWPSSLAKVSLYDCVSLLKHHRCGKPHWNIVWGFVNSLLSGSFLIKFSSLSAPTKIEELTAGSDENVAQWLERATRIRKTLGSIPGGAALFFFFSSDPAVSSSIFVGAERVDNLIVWGLFRVHDIMKVICYMTSGVKAAIPFFFF